MMKNTRYSFWKVFWVVLAFHIFFAAIGLIATYLSPLSQEAKELKDSLSLANVVNQIIGFLFSTFYYYFVINIFYGLIREKKSLYHYLRISVIVVFILCLYYYVSYNFLGGNERIKEKMTTGLIFLSYTLATLFYLGVALLVAYLTYLRDQRKQQKILEEQKMQLEVEKSQANFNFLKAQINPHFLHNTLNFLYAKSLPYSTELSEGILTLSDIMRYALSDGNTRDGKALLKEEIEHVRNVIKINQLRFSNNLNVEFVVEGTVNGATIIPFVLITLVENAFKHGDLKSNDFPITVRLKVGNGQLHFYCRNKKKSGPKELSTGIGLDNIKKRLELAYGKDYRFEVKDENEFYTTELTITRL